MQNIFKNKTKTIIISVVTAIFVLTVYQVSFGQRIFLPQWVIDSVREMFGQETFISLEPYKDGTIILVKPVATGDGDGRYEAGDIVEIRDGAELYERFGPDKPFLGEKELTKLLPLYYDGKLTEEQKQSLLAPDTEVTEYSITSSDGSETKGDRIIKRRQEGIDYTEFLSNSEILKVRDDGKNLKYLPEIHLSNITTKRDNQLSVVEISPTLARIESVEKSLRSFARQVIRPALAQTVSESIVDPDNGTGTDYLSLNSWEGGEQAILTSTNEIALATCRSTGGSADTASFDIDGWTTDATRYIKIWTDPDDIYRHKGVWNDNAYHFEVSLGTETEAIFLNEEFVRFEGLQLSTSNHGTYAAVITVQDTVGATSDIRVDSTIFQGTLDSGATENMGYQSYTSNNVKSTLTNNIFYNFNHTSGGGATGQTAIWLSSTYGTLYAYNNTFYNVGYALEIASGVGNTLYAKNNLAQSCDNSGGHGCYYTAGGSFHASSDYNVSDDIEDDDEINATYTSGDIATSTFVSTSNLDFHLAANDTAARNVGMDLSADGAFPFSEDIDGNARDYGEAWDIGADERNCPDNWWGCEWQYRMKISIDNSAQSTASSDFPASVQLNPDRINYFHTQDDGQDIRFVDANSTTTLQYEIEQWDETATSSLFVRIPEVTAASTDYIFMYYGNTAVTSTATTTGVWDDNFVLVQHLNEAVNNTSDGYTDSTSYGNHGTGNSMSLTEADGIVGTAQDFDGTADFIEMSHTSELTSGTGPYTMEVWFKVPNATQYGTFLNKNNDGAPVTNMGISDGTLQGVGNSISGFYGTDIVGNLEMWWPNNDVTDDSWHYAAMSIVSSVGSMYYDTSLLSKLYDLGTPNDTNTGTFNIGAHNTSVGHNGFLDGLADEVRISNTNRSSDWLDLTYCNIKETCMTYGAEQTVGDIKSIYRSVGPANTSALAQGSSTTTVTVHNDIAYFTNPLPDRIGVGDVIQYDINNDGTVDTLAFIHGRTDAQHYTVKNVNGYSATDVSADADWEIYRAYTSLSNAETGTENTGINSSLRDFDTWSGGRDLAANNEQWNIALYGDGTDSSAVISGWTTSAANYLRLFTPVTSDEVGTSQRHNGHWDANKYNMVDSVEQITLEPGIDNLVIDGLQIANGRSDNVWGGIYHEGRLANVTSKNNIIVSLNFVGGTGIGYPDSSNSGINYIVNNIVYGFAYGVYTRSPSYANYIYNNTVVGGTYGIRCRDSYTYAKNNLAYGNSTDSFYDTSCHTDSTNNAGDGTTVDGSSPIDLSGVPSGDIFVNYSGDDYRLSAQATTTVNVGANLLSDSGYAFSTDILGITRPQGGVWDVGAHEVATTSPVSIYRSVGPSNTSAVATTTASGISMKISENTATFSGNLPDNVGVGDAIQYDATGDGNIDSIAFISGRNSASSFSVQDYEGNSATSTMNIDGDTDWAVYRAYTSLANAEAGTENTGLDDGVQYFENWANGRNIAAYNEVWNISIYADGYESSPVTIDDWTTATSTYLKVYTPNLPSEVGASQRHEGMWNNNKYYITGTDPSGGVIIVRDDYTWIDGLQVFNNYTGGSTNRYAVSFAYTGSCNYCKISNSIIKGADSTEDRGLYTGSANSKGVQIWNNIVYDFGGFGIRAYFDSTTGDPQLLYNNTVYNSGAYCFDSNEDYKVNPVLINNIAQGCTDGYHNYYDGSSDYNVSDISSDAPGSNSQTGTVIFSNATQDDYRLDPSDTVAKDYATSSPATDSNLSFTTDIEGAGRQGSWDIGADEAGFKFPVKVKGGFNIKGGVKLK